jgi:hypothetical protein
MQASRDLIQKYEARGATSASARGNKQPRKKKKVDRMAMCFVLFSVTI